MGPRLAILARLASFYDAIVTKTTTPIASIQSQKSHFYEMKNQLKTNAALPARYYETFEVKTVVPHARSTFIVVLSAKIKPTILYY